MSPEQALASNAELPPAYDGNSRSDNHVSKIHTEIKVNGRVIARVFNSGAIQIAGEYGFITDELRESFAADRKVGPELAEERTKRVKAALERHGVLDKEKLDTDGLMAARQDADSGAPARQHGADAGGMAGLQGQGRSDDAGRLPRNVGLSRSRPATTPCGPATAGKPSAGPVAA